MREWESGKAGVWESGRAGEWESGKMGEREWEGRSGKLGKWPFSNSSSLPFSHSPTLPPSLLSSSFKEKAVQKEGEAPEKILMRFSYKFILDLIGKEEGDSRDDSHGMHRFSNQVRCRKNRKARGRLHREL